jgi:ATP-dependent DNA ligase
VGISSSQPPRTPWRGNAVLCVFDLIEFEGEDLRTKRLGLPYRSGRSAYWVKVKNPKAPAVKREGQEAWTFSH